MSIIKNINLTQKLGFMKLSINQNFPCNQMDVPYFFALSLGTPHSSDQKSTDIPLKLGAIQKYLKNQ